MSSANHYRLDQAVFTSAVNKTSPVKLFYRDQVEKPICVFGVQRLSSSTLHYSLCLSPWEHKMLKLSVTLTYGDGIFKEQIAIRTSYKAKVIYRNTVTEVFSLDTSSNFF